MKKIDIVGAGDMGSGIVQKTAQEGLAVVMVDVKDDSEIMNAVGIEKSWNMVEYLLGPYPKVSVPPVLTSQKEKGVPWSVD